MKIDGQRLLSSQNEHPLKMQTWVVTFSTDEAEDLIDMFGVRLADIPKRPNAIKGEPDLVSCKITFILDTKKESITFERLQFGCDVYGENPVAEADEEKIGQWLPMKKIAFRKYEINEELVEDTYPRNTIVDALKQTMFKSGRL